MPKLKKRYLRNKFNHLKTYSSFISIDVSNLTFTEINSITAQVGTINCHSALSYTEPPKLTGGCLIVRIFPTTVGSIEPLLKELLAKKMFLGLYIKTSWYSTQLLKRTRQDKNKYKTISLLIKKIYIDWLEVIE